MGGAAILSQRDSNTEWVIAYCSVKWDEEVKYSASEKEALAVLKSIEHFRGYIYESQFTVITDAAALTHIRTMRVEGQRQLFRWALA